MSKRFIFPILMILSLVFSGLFTSWTGAVAQIMFIMVWVQIKDAKQIQMNSQTLHLIQARL